METTEGSCKESPVAQTVAVEGRDRESDRKNREHLCAEALSQLPGSKIDGEYDPLMLDLFVYRRAVAPRDTAWESAPLVLHDEGLITVRVGWPPHEPEQPWDLVEAMTRILGHHPGPVSSFRLHSSLSPDVDTLGCWMDLLSEKGVAELIIFNLYQDVSTAQLPLQRLTSYHQCARM
ncbi:uncharacterized protein LOC100381480 [Zea mays]|uniref:Uncharacterized protein n=1 Tax=Zea mays TaxID=4577 RepID=C0HGA8_MAIZE|nr:uncharacterized protein LOC100381480 [Zea mays]ACN26061.1 unknown [Zea mays]|eukprot:NP_001167787.1 uncharacterized protein LOC100381480 [Zea mays]